METDYAIPCAIDGCYNPADDIDPTTGIPACRDCLAELDAVFNGNTCTLWEAAAEGWKWGLIGGAFSRIFGR